MSSDTTNSLSDGNAPTGEPLPPSLASGLPDANHLPAWASQLVSVLLSLFLAVFLADAAVSLVCDSLNLLFRIRLPAAILAPTSIVTLLLAILIYVLTGLTPLIPKRLFVPMTLFCVAAILAPAPFAIYYFSRLWLVSWVISCCQCILGLWILRRAQGGVRLRWPLVPIERLGMRLFSWGNLCKFAVGNLFVLLPAVLAYLFLCAVMLVSHFSDGFVALRPSGITVQSRKYVRDDGKTIQLFPMVHIADAEFYRAISQSFPANSAVLMEGVSDEKHLLTKGINYEKVAASLGLSEQQTEFTPSANEVVNADVDIDQFSTSSIDFLKLTMNGLRGNANAGDTGKLIHLASSAGFMNQLMDDLVIKRNEHVLGEIMSHLSHSDTIMVPWGAAHIPGIAREIQNSGFRLIDTQDYSVIRFRFFGRAN